jgi:hypothetical protein
MGLQGWGKMGKVYSPKQILSSLYLCEVWEYYDQMTTSRAYYYPYRTRVTSISGRKLLILCSKNKVKLAARVQWGGLWQSNELLRFLISKTGQLNTLRTSTKSWLDYSLTTYAMVLQRSLKCLKGLLLSTADDLRPWPTITTPSLSYIIVFILFRQEKKDWQSQKPVLICSRTWVIVLSAKIEYRDPKINFTAQLNPDCYGIYRYSVCNTNYICMAESLRRLRLGRGRRPPASNSEFNDATFLGFYDLSLVYALRSASLAMGTSLHYSRFHLCYG